MAIRKILIFCFSAPIVVIVGYFIPYASNWESNVHLWLFGYINAPGYGYMLPLVDEILTMFLLGIVVVVIMLLTIVTCIIFRRRNGGTIGCIIKGVGGAVITILGLLPPIVDPITFSYLSVSIGFYVILIGAILQIVLGIYCLALHRKG